MEANYINILTATEVVALGDNRGLVLVNYTLRNFLQRFSIYSLQVFFKHGNVGQTPKEVVSLQLTKIRMLKLQKKTNKKNQSYYLR